MAKRKTAAPAPPVEREPTFEMYDVRVLDRNRQGGAIKPEQYEKFFDDLEDCSDNADSSAVQMVARTLGRRVPLASDAAREEDES